MDWSQNDEHKTTVRRLLAAREGAADRLDAAALGGGRGGRRVGRPGRAGLHLRRRARAGGRARRPVRARRDARAGAAGALTGGPWPARRRPEVGAGVQPEARSAPHERPGSSRAAGRSPPRRPLRASRLPPRRGRRGSGPMPHLHRARPRGGLPRVRERAAACRSRSGSLASLAARRPDVPAPSSSEPEFRPPSLSGATSLGSTSPRRGHRRRGPLRTAPRLPGPSHRVRDRGPHRLRPCAPSAARDHPNEKERPHGRHPR